MGVAIATKPQPEDGRLPYLNDSRMPFGPEDQNSDSGKL